MPIYEYVCKACGRESEITQRMSDAPARKCPACGKLRLEKLMSAAGFRLSGGGWYESDFKSGSKKNLAGDKADAAPCTPTGCEKPGCAAKADKPAKSAKPAKKEKAAVA